MQHDEVLSLALTRGKLKPMAKSAFNKGHAKPVVHVVQHLLSDKNKNATIRRVARLDASQAQHLIPLLSSSIQGRTLVFEANLIDPPVHAVRSMQELMLMVKVYLLIHSSSDHGRRYEDELRTLINFDSYLFR